MYSLAILLREIVYHQAGQVGTAVLQLVRALVPREPWRSLFMDEGLAVSRRCLEKLGVCPFQPFTLQPLPNQFSIGETRP